MLAQGLRCGADMKVPVHCSSRQPQAGRSCCRSCALGADYVRRGRGRAGRKSCVYTPLLGHCSAADQQREGARAGLEASPSVTAVSEEKPLPPAERALQLNARQKAAAAAAGSPLTQTFGHTCPLASSALRFRSPSPRKPGGLEQQWLLAARQHNGQAEMRAPQRSPRAASPSCGEGPQVEPSLLEKEGEDTGLKVIRKGFHVVRAN